MSTCSTFCPLPWNHISTTSAGSFRVCCNSDEQRNKLSDPDGGVPKIYRENFLAVRNYDLLKLIRSEMKRGERPSVCSPCFESELSTGYSPRMAYKESFDLDEKEVFKNTGEDGLIESSLFPIQYIDIRLGNLCNLKCRMCNSWSSSSWNEEAQEIFNSEDVGLYDWPTKKVQWIEQVVSHSSLQELYLTGGEPTLIEENINLLNRLISLKLNKVRIKINSNLVHLSPKFISTLEKFENVLFKCSIDGHGLVNDYIRFPSNFNEISKNLELVKKKFSVEIQSTVQAYNIFSCGDWIKWCKNHVGIVPDLYPLREPRWLDIRAMNPKFKSLVEKRFENVVNDLSSDEIEKLRFFIDEVSTEYGPSCESDFRKYTHAMDKYRNQKVGDFIPELRGL